MTPELEKLEKELGHTFGDRQLLERALTHKSRVYEKTAGQPATDNEQLEFLGDAILGFVVSESLVRRYPSYPEGRLSKLKAHLVSAARLHEVAQELSLGDFLILGRGEEMSGGREKKALLADAAEALIAALYLDAGLEAARQFIENRVVGALHSDENGEDAAVTDYKSALQEMAQALKLPPPRYIIIGEDGPEHSKTFTVEVRLGKEWISQAQGLSKKSAGQRAAQQILQQLTEWGR
ncbi:MAG TPA: ribonuclease III [Bryobacteraceae bacterium]|jgi:ribonuclease-3|nr:ribonuclease III [Bryobacteraceae bacterium]